MRSGWSPPQLLDLSHLHDHHPSYILIVPQSAPLTFTSSAPRPRHPWSSGGAFQGGKRGGVGPPRQPQVADPPQSAGFCLQLPTLVSVASSFLALPRGPIFARPPHQALHQHLSQHSQSLPARPRFLPSPLKYSVPDQNPMFPH